MKLRFLTMLVAFGLLAAAPALAMDLQQARSTGIVGETLSGYIAAVKPSAEANALVAEVNAKRKQEYARISAANSQPVDVVAKLASEQIIAGLPAGSYYQTASGAWKQR